MKSTKIHVQITIFIIDYHAITTQRILYDQLHASYLDPQTQAVIIIITTRLPTGPYGTLRFNPHSLLYQYATCNAYVDQLQEQGITAHCIIADDYDSGLSQACSLMYISSLIVMNSSEPYHQRGVQSALDKSGLSYKLIANTQFLIQHDEFVHKFPDPPIMETFYRWMRTEHDILMEDDKPTGGSRNYDKDNRKYDRKHTTTSHPRYQHHFRTQAQQFYRELRSSQPHPYSLPDDIFTQESLFPITHEQAIQCIDEFIAHHLDDFGRLEDAMYDHDPLVHHSIISAALNIGLLTPHYLIATISATDTAINNKEGYIRQVLGRREYMYHFFTSYQDTIYEQNHHNYLTPLPDWFWEPDLCPLDMYCIQDVLHTVKQNGYSHHITRLMIIGNFCQLMGYNPHDLNRWFWEMYTDAYERVVTPNVLSMSQYADGGKLATKPYVSSANYIHKMSNYCDSCRYDPKLKTGPDACPFNALYRDFLDRNQETFRAGRQGFILKHLEKLDMHEIRTQVDQFHQSLQTQAQAQSD